MSEANVVTARRGTVLIAGLTRNDAVAWAMMTGVPCGVQSFGNAWRVVAL